MTRKITIYIQMESVGPLNKSTIYHLPISITNGFYCNITKNHYIFKRITSVFHVTDKQDPL
jgi:hypothetical protein